MIVVLFDGKKLKHLKKKEHDSYLPVLLKSIKRWSVQKHNERKQLSHIVLSTDILYLYCYIYHEPLYAQHPGLACPVYSLLFLHVYACVSPCVSRYFSYHVFSILNAYYIKAMFTSMLTRYCVYELLYAKVCIYWMQICMWKIDNLLTMIKIFIYLLRMIVYTHLPILSSCSRAQKLKCKRRNVIIARNIELNRKRIYDWIHQHSKITNYHTSIMYVRYSLRKSPTYVG